MDFPNYQRYVAVIAQRDFWILVISSTSLVIVAYLILFRVYRPNWLRLVRPLIVAVFFVTLVIQALGV